MLNFFLQVILPAIVGTLFVVFLMYRTKDKR